MSLPTDLAQLPANAIILALFAVFVYWMFRELSQLMRAGAKEFRAVAGDFVIELRKIDENARMERIELLKVFVQINRDTRAEMLEKLDKIETLVQALSKKARPD